MGLRRITLDFDTRNLIKIFWNLRKVFRYGFRELYIKPSRKKGYHIFIWVTANKCRSEKQKFKLREAWGDDKKHIALDKFHKTARQTLFNRKRKIK